MNTKFIFASALCLASLSFTACSDDESDILPEPPEYERQEQPTKGAFILTLQGKVDDGTPEGEYANMVYVNLDKQSQELVSRTSWHLGFYNGKEACVTLNQSHSRAYGTGKYNFAEVGEADAKAEDFPDIAGGMMTFPNDKVVTDATDGDLKKTLFGEISTESSKNQVFFVASEALEKSDWYKVKITAVAGGYHMEYGNINAKTAQEVTIKKNEDNQFIAFSLESGKVVELPKKWDLMWSKAIALTTMPNGKEILGPSSDVVTSNRHGGVEVAIVKVNNPQQVRDEFEQFTKEGVAGLSFSADADVLGTDWRLTPMPGAIAPGPKADRFYVFKNSEGNLFKVRFLHFCEEDGGERGLPMMEAAPLK